MYSKIKLRHHAKDANCTPLRQEVTQSHAEDLRDLLHGMHPGDNTTLSLPDHRAVEHSKGKNWGVPGMGNDILTSAIPLRL